MSSQLLGSRDLDGDGTDESIYLYAFDGCQAKLKAGTTVLVFYKTGGVEQEIGDRQGTDHDLALLQ